MANPLNTYKKKRDLKKSGEPSGNNKNTLDKCLFVIQKHDASQLHYDFRLRIGNVLKSWAVPKGLSTKANEKRLAIKTEDHPLDYANFEGIIPEDEYGGGVVLVWDKGSFEPIIEDKEHDKSLAQAIENGSLKFNLYGQKLKGGYALARIDKEKDQWVIFKLDDKFADGRRKPTSTQPKSVLSDKTIEQIKKEND